VYKFYNAGVVWRSGNVVCDVDGVALCRVWLVLGLVIRIPVWISANLPITFRHTSLLCVMALSFETYPLFSILPISLLGPSCEDSQLPVFWYRRIHLSRR